MVIKHRKRFSVNNEEKTHLTFIPCQTDKYASFWLHTLINRPTRKRHCILDKKIPPGAWKPSDRCHKSYLSPMDLPFCPASVLLGMRSQGAVVDTMPRPSGLQHGNTAVWAPADVAEALPQPAASRRASRQI